MFKRLKRWALRQWLRRKLGPMVIGSPQEIDEWIERVVQDRIP